MQCQRHWCHLQASGDRPWRSVITPAAFPLDLKKASRFVRYWHVTMDRARPDPRVTSYWNSGTVRQQNAASTISWLLYVAKPVRSSRWHRDHLDRSWQGCLHTGNWLSSVSTVHHMWTSCGPRWQHSVVWETASIHRQYLNSHTHSLLTTHYTTVGNRLWWTTEYTHW